MALVPLVIAGAVRRGWTLSQIIASSAFVPLSGGFLLLVVYMLVTRQSLVCLGYHLSGSNVAGVARIFSHGGAYARDRGSDSALPQVETLRQFVLAIFPGMLVVNHLLTNTLNYVLARYYCSRRRPPVALDAEMLTHWRASDYLVWVFIASGVALLLPMALLSTIGLNVFLVTLAIYLLQGLAIAVFWGQRLPIPLGIRWFLTLISARHGGASVCRVMYYGGLVRPVG